jgi:hypothetical protein
MADLTLATSAARQSPICRPPSAPIVPMLALDLGTTTGWALHGASTG